MTYEQKVPVGLHDSASSTMNDARTCESIGTGLVQPRSLSDLASFMHGYVIKSGGDGNEPRRFRAAHIEGLIRTLPEAADADHVAAILWEMRRQATELAALDPSLSWLPEWKPRVATPALSSRDA